MQGISKHATHMQFHTIRDADPLPDARYATTEAHCPACGRVLLHGAWQDRRYCDNPYCHALVVVHE
jgi:hypothetical protein